MIIMVMTREACEGEDYGSALTYATALCLVGLVEEDRLRGEQLGMIRDLL